MRIDGRLTATPDLADPNAVAVVVITDASFRFAAIEVGANGLIETNRSIFVPRLDIDQWEWAPTSRLRMTGGAPGDSTTLEAFSTSSMDPNCVAPESIGIFELASGANVKLVDETLNVGNTPSQCEETVVVHDVDLPDPNKPRAVLARAGIAFESSTPLEPHEECQVFATIPGDLNGDCEINLTDLASVLQSFGTSTGICVGTPGDANQDGLVDLSDLAVVLGGFGMTCDQW